MGTSFHSLADFGKASQCWLRFPAFIAQSGSDVAHGIWVPESCVAHNVATSRAGEIGSSPHLPPPTPTNPHSPPTSRARHTPPEDIPLWSVDR